MVGAPSPCRRAAPAKSAILHPCSCGVTLAFFKRDGRAAGEPIASALVGDVARAFKPRRTLADT
jgi:hypothetical protein